MKNFTPFFFLFLLISTVLSAQITYTSKGGDWFINFGKYIKSGTGIRTINLTQFVNSGEVKVDAGKFIKTGKMIKQK